MSNLPSQHPTISMHLTDVSLTPLITSSRSRSQLESLTALANTALTSQSACKRVKLGAPERIMVEYPDRGPVVLHSYLDPSAQEQETERRRLEKSHHSTAGHGGDDERDGSVSPGTVPPRTGEEDDHTLLAPSIARAHEEGESHSESPAEVNPEDAPPVLLSLVVASSADQAQEARRAAAKLERVAKDFQQEWANDKSATGYEEPLVIRSHHGRPYSPGSG